MSDFDLSIAINDKVCDKTTNFVTCDDKLCHLSDITIADLCHSHKVLSIG